MQVKKFNELTDEQLDKLIDIHFNHWVQYNPKMEKQNTIYKFKELYRDKNLPFGIALFNNQNNIIGFCVLKIINLEKHKEFSPWISNLIILKEHRDKGYGKLLVKEATGILKALGYKKVYNMDRSNSRIL